MRASKPSLPQPVGSVLDGLSGLNLGRIVKLPVLGLNDQLPNFEWSLLSGSHEVPKPDVRLEAITTEWEQSLTSIQLNFSGRFDSQVLKSNTKGRTCHRSMLDQNKEVSAVIARVNTGSHRMYDLGFQYDGKTNVVQTVTG